MATGFCKLYYQIGYQPLVLINSVLNFFEENGVYTKNEFGMVLSFVDEGEVSRDISYEDFLTWVNTSRSDTAFYLVVTDISRLYVRFFEDPVTKGTIEEYDFAWLDTDDEERVCQLILERIKNQALGKEAPFLGAMIDRIGYTEEYDWDSLLLDSNFWPSRFETPTVICTVRDLDFDFPVEAGKIGIFNFTYFKQSGYEFLRH